MPFARALPLWPDPLTKAFCAEVSGAWLWSQKSHGRRGGGRRGAWGRGRTHRAGADGEEKHRLVCLSGGSSIRWEFSGLRSLLTHECLQECVCVGVWESPHLCHKCWSLVGILVIVHLPEGLTLWAVASSWAEAVTFPLKAPHPKSHGLFWGVCQRRCR